MYEIIQHSHSSPCRYPINIERPHFMDFRHFGEVDQGGSATYIFSNTLRTLLLLLSRGGDPLLSNLRFFGRLRLVGCVAFGPSVSLGTGVFSSKHTSVTICTFSLPSFSTSEWSPSCWTCCCVLGAPSLIPSVSFSCPLRHIPFDSPLLAPVPRSGGVAVFILLLLSVSSRPDTCLCS